MSQRKRDLLLKVQEPPPIWKKGMLDLDQIRTSSWRGSAVCSVDYDAQEKVSSPIANSIGIEGSGR
jgi:hypothetical protein